MKELEIDRKVREQGLDRHQLAAILDVKEDDKTNTVFVQAVLTKSQETDEFELSKKGGSGLHS